MDSQERSAGSDINWIHLRKPRPTQKTLLVWVKLGMTWLIYIILTAVPGLLSVGSTDWNKFLYFWKRFILLTMHGVVVHMFRLLFLNSSLSHKNDGKETSDFSREFTSPLKKTTKMTWSTRCAIFSMNTTHLRKSKPGCTRANLS